MQDSFEILTSAKESALEKLLGYKEVRISEL